MVLRLVILLSLVALVLSGGDGPMSMEGEGSADEMMPDTDEVPDLDYRYMEPQAVRMRADHFYCLLQNDTEGFPDDIVAEDNSNTVYRRWGLFLQYPILNYLETLGKLEILRVVANLVQAGNPNLYSNFNESDFCIATVFHYEVSTYDESILINLYFEDEMMDIRAFDTAFRAGFMMNLPQYVDIDFLGRRALIINLPGHNARGLDAEDDPTQRAVVIGSYVGNTTIERALSESYQSFADNPDPINFGLEAGDIVFAVIGSVFLAIVGGLIVLGFCIHPFLA